MFNLGTRMRGERRVVLILLLAYWLGFQVIFFNYLVLSERPAPLPNVGRYAASLMAYIFRPSELLITACGAALCLGIYEVLGTVRRAGLLSQLLLAFLGAVAGAGLFAFAVEIVLNLFRVQHQAPDGPALILEMTRWFPPFGLWAVLCLALTYRTAAHQREVSLAIAQGQMRDAQLRALRYQVDPHFLYNTLNSLSALVLDGKNEEAERVIAKLSSFFRSSLEAHPTAEVPLADEIALQRLYLEIEQVRFGGALIVEIDVPDELGALPVPNLLLQPLIENALKHGFRGTSEFTRLRIAATSASGGFWLEVADDGLGVCGGEGTGTGLSNVRARLATRYGAASRMETEAMPGRGFSVRLFIPG